MNIAIVIGQRRTEHSLVESDRSVHVDRFMEASMKVRVSEAMTRDVRLTTPDETIQKAARLMASLDAGVLPVGENDRLVGMITDRDIAIRGVAQGKGPRTKVREVMTADVKYCFDDQDVEEVTRNMADIQVRRLPVVNHDKRLVGILSLSDIAISHDGMGAAEALSGIARPGGQHTQTG
jgi:CBS domain-containing protein